MANTAATGSGQAGQGRHGLPDRSSDPSPDQSPAEQPKPRTPGPRKDDEGRWPPDGIPNPMPGVDPEQTPGIDRL